MVVAYFVNHLQLQDSGQSPKQRQQKQAAAAAVAAAVGNPGRIITSVNSSSPLLSSTPVAAVLSSLIASTSSSVSPLKRPDSKTTPPAPTTTTSKVVSHSISDGESLLGLDIPWSTYVELFAEVDSDWWIWLIVGVIALAIVGVCIAIVCWCALARPRGGLMMQNGNNNTSNQQSSEQSQTNVVKRVFFHGRPESRTSMSTVSTPSELNTPMPQYRKRSPPAMQRPPQQISPKADYARRSEAVISVRPGPPPQAPPSVKAPSARPAPPNIIIKQPTPQGPGLPLPPYNNPAPQAAPALPNVNKEISQSFVQNRPGYYERGYNGSERF